MGGGELWVFKRALRNIHLLTSMDTPAGTSNSRSVKNVKNIEKGRKQRERMNEGYRNLRSVLPFTHPKTSKISILNMAAKYILSLQSQLQEPSSKVVEEPQSPSILKEMLSAPHPIETVFIKEDKLADQHFFEEEPSAYKQLFLLDEDQDE